MHMFFQYKTSSSLSSNTVNLSKKKNSKSCCTRCAVFDNLYIGFCDLEMPCEEISGRKWQWGFKNALNFEKKNRFLKFSKWVQIASQTSRAQNTSETPRICYLKILFTLKFWLFWNSRSDFWVFAYFAQNTGEFIFATFQIQESFVYECSDL